MSMIIERVARTIFEVSAPYADHCCLTTPDFDKCKGCAEIAISQARAALADLRDVFNITNNSSLNFAADELQAELDEDAAELSK